MRKPGKASALKKKKKFLLMVATFLVIVVTSLVMVTSMLATRVLFTLFPNELTEWLVC